MKAKEKIKIKLPEGGRWKKVMAIFDVDSDDSYASQRLLKELGAKVGAFEENVRLHVKVLGDDYSWSFGISTLPGKEKDADLVFGREFMSLQGVILKQTSKGAKIGYAPGYPQSPVI